MRLALVRHAEAAEDARGLCYGRLDVGLSQRGRVQCASLAEAFRHETIDAVLASPAVRARETGVAIATPHRLGVDVVEPLRELDFGELEGRSYEEIAESDPELYERWMTARRRCASPEASRTPTSRRGSPPGSRGSSSTRAIGTSWPSPTAA